ncbi:MAG: DUF3179 domain-containing protein [Omnitrophica bacterium]|nr:DUF3179 domain-containing protein [Candidatus Omnitrophota bacterium]
MVKFKNILAGLLSIFLLFIIPGPVFSALEDFDLSEAIIDISTLRGGGPAKDGIPAISKPKFVSAKEALFLKDKDMVIGVLIGKEAKAYPINILNWHEIVNDSILNKEISVTWCPLTRSGIVFNRRTKKGVVDFGVSGLLYNSNLVMYDRPSDSLWPQLSLGAVTGAFVNQKLTILPSLITTWTDWRKRHPHTLVLSDETGFSRDYKRDPYSAYHASQEMMFSLSDIDRRLPAKSLVLGIKIQGIAKAYPISSITEKPVSFYDSIGDKRIKVHIGFNNTAYVTDTRGNILPAIRAYWFAWSSFNKDTLIFTSE